jgi:hypothetical protein
MWLETPPALSRTPRLGQNTLPSPRTWEKLAILLDGMNPAEAELIGRPVAGTVGPQEAPAFVDYLGGLISAGPGRSAGQPGRF